MNGSRPSFFAAVSLRSRLAMLDGAVCLRSCAAQLPRSPDRAISSTVCHSQKNTDVHCKFLCARIAKVAETYHFSQYLIAALSLLAAAVSLRSCLAMQSRRAGRCGQIEDLAAGDFERTLLSLRCWLTMLMTMLMPIMNRS